MAETDAVPAIHEDGSVDADSAVDRTNLYVNLGPACCQPILTAAVPKAPEAPSASSAGDESKDDVESTQ
ncbi:hypothetical protein PtA15_9A474 [Puccinia triticina]|uniref:Uncharacterized protein n=1 Tax=Puccinia triticina TaxID=208348 RepID=A0ABY7D066_9BASI|nr:uncharacterized protein PtA15_9A474 [Puccinia triticina]WAQ88347.1 hypothetical protein PtA15_9A474 [Puccinia triticina]WAR60526.1 hypothetical protein PtB15_9B465 [Puccinia triticina]